MSLRVQIGTGCLLHPRSPADAKSCSPSSDLKCLIEPKQLGARLQEMLEHAKSCIRQSQRDMETYANRKRRHAEFQIGDWVLLSAKHLRLKFDGVKKIIGTLVPSRFFKTLAI